MVRTSVQHQGCNHAVNTLSRAAASPFAFLQGRRTWVHDCSCSLVRKNNSNLLYTAVPDAGGCGPKAGAAADLAAGQVPGSQRHGQCCTVVWYTSPNCAMAYCHSASVAAYDMWAGTV